MSGQEQINRGTPECPSGNNSECTLQYKQLHGIDLGIEQKIPGLGKIDEGDCWCNTCGSQWKYMLVMNEYKYIDRPRAVEPETHNHDHDGECESCKV